MSNPERRHSFPESAIEEEQAAISRSVTQEHEMEAARTRRLSKSEGHGIPDDALAQERMFLQRAEQERHETDAAMTRRGLTDDLVRKEHEFIHHIEEEEKVFEKSGMPDQAAESEQEFFEGVEPTQSDSVKEEMAQLKSVITK